MAGRFLIYTYVRPDRVSIQDSYPDEVLLNSFHKQSVMVAIPIQYSMPPGEKPDFHITFRIEFYEIKSFPSAKSHERNIVFFRHRML